MQFSRRSRSSRKARAILAGAVATLGVALTPVAHATNYYWDTNGSAAGLLGGTGTWDAGTTALWSLDANGTSPNAFYANGVDVFFNDITNPNTITVNGTVNADSMTFGTALANTISGGTINLGGGEFAGITVLAAETSATTISSSLNLLSNQTFSNFGTGLLTISGGITGTGNLNIQNNGATSPGIVLSTGTINNAGTITNSGTGGGTVSISSNILGNVTGIVENSLTSTMTLSGDDTAFTGPVTVTKGTLIANSVVGTSAFGSAVISIGDSVTDFNSATLTFGGTQGTFNNAIVLNSGTKFNGFTNTGIVAINSGNSSTALTLTGGVTGNNNLTINGAFTVGMTFTTNAINNVGTINNAGTAAGIVNINGGIGSNVTAINENSVTSPINIGGTGIVVNSGGTTINNNAASGTTAIITISGGVSGTGNLTLNNNNPNSITTGGIVFNTGSINNVGTVTNSGIATGAIAGPTVINSVIGTNVTGLTQSSQGVLTLTANNTFTGPTNDIFGTINVNGAAGQLSGTSAVTIAGGGNLNLGDATNGIVNRINAAGVPLTLGGANGSGGLLIFRGNATTANSQTFSSLTIGGGAAIADSGTTGVAPTLTFSGATPYLRTVGGLLNVTSANFTFSFTNAPSIANGSSVIGATSPILTGAILNSADFIAAGNTTLAATTYTNDTFTTGLNVNATLATETPAASSSFQSLKFNTAVASVVTLSGTNTIESGGILVGSTATSATITGGNLQGPAGGDLWIYLNTKPLTISSSIIDNTSASGLTFGSSASGTLTLSGANTYTGTTNVQGALLTLSTPGANGTSIVAIPGNLNINGGVGTLSNVTLTASNEIANTAVVTFGPNTSANSSRLVLGPGNTQILAGISTPVLNTGAIIEASDTGAVAGTATLVINNSSNFTFDGLLRNTGGTVAVLALTKQNSGKLTLMNTRNNASTNFTGATTISGGTLALVDNGNGALIGSWASPITDNAVLELDNTSVSTAETFGQIISGTGGVVNVNAGTSSIVLKAANTFTGGLNILNGTVNATTVATALGGTGGAGTVTIGSSVGSAYSTLNLGFNGTFLNPIIVASGNTGVATISSSASTGTLSGGVTLNSHDVVLSPQAGALAISGGITGTGNILINATSTNALTLSGTSINNAGTITNLSSGTATNVISAVVGSNVTGVVQNSTTSALTLSNPGNTFTGGLQVLAGTVSIGAQAASPTTITPFGVGTLSLGNTTGNANVTLTLNAGTAATYTITNPLTTVAGSTGTYLMQQTTGTIIMNGPVTLNHDLTLRDSNSTTGTFTLSGSITGSGGNLFLNSTSTASPIVLSGASINFAGAITNVGTSTSTCTVSGTLGSNITAVVQAGDNPFTVSSVLPIATLNTFNSYGSGTFTLSNAVSGTANLTFNANSSGNIVVSSAVGSFNPAGTVTNSGTGTGTVIIGNGTAFGSIGTSVTGIIQNSPTSTLQLNSSTASSYSGPISILAGTLNEGGIGSVLGVASNHVTLGNSTPGSTANATLNAINSFTYAQPIDVVAGSSGTMTVSTSAGTSIFSGAVTMHNNLTLATLGAAVGMSFTGGFTGTGNLTLNASIAAPITISTNGVNMAGSITNVGNGNAYTTISTNIGSNVTSLTQNGQSDMVLSGVNTYTGATTVLAGVLDFQNTTSMPGYPSPSPIIPVSAGATLVLGYGGSGATFNFTSADVANVLNGTTATLAPGSNFGFDTGVANATYSVAITNPIGLVKMGANSLTLTGSNTFSGPVAIQAGTLSVSSINSVATPAASSNLGVPSSVANGTITLGYATTTGTLSYTGPGETTDRNLVMAGTTGGAGFDQSGSGQLVFNGSFSITGVGAKTLTLSGSTNADGTISGNILGGQIGSASPLTIAKTGTGTWHLTGGTSTQSNTAQNITIAGGTLDTGTFGLALNDKGVGTIQASATATVNGKIILGGPSNAANDGGDIGDSLTGGILTINATIVDAATPQTFIDVYGGNSAGTLVLTGANTFASAGIDVGEILQVSTINSVTTNATTGAVHSASSNLGAPSSTTAGEIYLGFSSANVGTLRYVGTGETTDRIVNLASTTAGGTVTIDQSGTGVLKFVTNFQATGAVTHTLNLQGSTAGTGVIAGNIVDNATGITTLTKNGTSSWTLSGANTYTGNTTVNVGNLSLANPGSMANTHMTVANGATLSIAGGTFTAGNVAAPTAGATLTLNAGSVLNLADGNLGNFNIVQGATFAGAAATFNGASLNFDIGASTSDAVNIALNNAAGTGVAASSGLNSVSLSAVSGATSLNTSTPYVLIQAGSGLNLSNFYLPSSNLYVNGTLYNVALAMSGTNLVANVTIGIVPVDPATAYWSGTLNSSWSKQTAGTGTTNWVTAPNGGSDTFALPGPTSNVILTANSVGAGGLSTTLDAALAINSLTFTGTGTANTAGSTIAPGTGGTLTINANAINGNAAGNGITVNAGSGANVISAPVVLAQSQTWTNNSTSTLTVSGTISDNGASTLTKAGTGTIALTGPNTFASGVNINAGALSVSSLGSVFTPGGLGMGDGFASSTVSIGNLTTAGTLIYTGTGETSDHFINLAGTTGGAILDQSGTGNEKFTAPLTATGAGTKSLTLQGSTAGTGELAGSIVDNLTGTNLTSVIKTGTGAWTLSGANTYTGNTNVNAGTLNVAGSITGNTTASSLVIGQSVAGNAVVNVSGNFTGFTTIGSSINGGVSVFNQTAGSVNVTPGTGNAQYVVKNTAGAYGMFNLSGGTYKVNGGGRFDLSNASLASGFATSVVYIGGGANPALLDQTNGEWFINAYSLGETTLLNNGTLNRTGAVAAKYFGLVMDTAQVGGSYGVLNLAGGTALLGATPLTFGNSTTNGSGNSGFINLASGTLGIGGNFVTSLPAAPSATNFLYINYAGGTFKATGNVTQFAPVTSNSVTVSQTIFGPINNSAVAGASSFNGGLVVDTNTFNVTIPATTPLLGATGDGVTQTNLTVNGGSGYVGAPAVQFSKPASSTGVAAAGYALMSGGSVVGIVITDPGVYAAGETPTITLTGGGATSAATVTSSALNTLNSTSGGVTKLGLGTLTLSANNTFTGVVDIKVGTLAVTALSNGGTPSTLGASSSAASNILLDGGVLQYASVVAPGTTDRNFTLSAPGGGFDASGTVAAATFTLTPANNIAIPSGLGSIALTLTGTATNLTGTGFFGSILADGVGTTVGLTKTGTGQWNITNNSTYTGPVTLTGGILSIASFANAGVPSTLGASANLASNLVFNGGTLQYTGAGDTSNRNFTLGNATTAAGGTIDSEGTGPLILTGTMTGANTASNTQVLNLIANTASGNNTITPPNDSSGSALTGVTKSGPGIWIISGTSNFSGATNVNAGTLQFAGSLAGTTPLLIGNTGTLQIHEDGTGSGVAINHSNSVTSSASGTVTIDVGNNGSANTGNTETFASLNNGTAANALVTTFNFTASNGYLQSYGTLALPGSTGQTTVLNPTTTTVTISGAVTNQETNFASGHFDTLQLDGTSTGNLISGSISDSSGCTGVGFADTRITKSNSSIWTLAGASTYHGPTAINGGTLILSGSIGGTSSLQGGTDVTVAPGAIFTQTAAGAILGVSTLNNSGSTLLAGANTYTGATTATAGTLTLTGSLGNTPISVLPGATFLAKAGSGTLTAGNNATAGAGASLNVAANGNFSMVDGGIGTFNIVQEGTFGFAALSLASANLNLELGAAGADQIIVSGGTIPASISGTNTVSITALGTSLTAGVFPIVTAPGIAAGNTNFQFSNGTATELLAVGSSTYTLSLNGVSGAEDITITSLASLSWTGLTNGAPGSPNSVWSATPGAKNFAVSTPTVAAADYAEGSAVIFQDLDVINGTNVSNPTVTIDAAGVNPSAVTVNNNNVNYTFQNAAGGTIGIAGATGLTKSGTGTLTLLGVNTYTGATAINGGIVNVGVADNGTSAGPLGATTGGGTISFNGGTLQYSAANTFDYSPRFSATANNFISIDTNNQTVTFASPLNSPGGTLTKIGLGKLILNSVENYTGNTTVNGGTLQLTTNNGGLGALASPIITVNTTGVLDLTTGDALGFTAGRNALVINGGTVQNNATGFRDTLQNTVTMTGGTLAGTSTGDANTGAYSWDVAAAVTATSDSSGQPAVISANTSTQVAPTFTVNRGAFAAPGAPDLVISGPITPYNGTFNGIVKAGAGIMTLSGSNTYTGGTTIQNGTVLVGNASALGPATNALTFGDNSGNAGSLNSQTFDVTVGSLTVITNTAATNVNNNIVIGNGNTFTVNGSVNVGSPTVGAGITNSNLVVTGATGTFTANLGTGALNVGFHNITAITPTGNGVSGVLDLSGVGTVNIIGSTNASTVVLGSDSTTQNVNTIADAATGVLKLSTTGTNTIAVGTITLGTSPASGFTPIQGFLTLGNAANNFNVDTLYVAHAKSQLNGTTPDLLNFAGSGGTLTLKGFAGGAAKTTLRIGYNDVGATGTISVGLMDLSNGAFNGQLGVVTLGFYNTTAGTGGGKGTLTVAAGATTLDSLVLASAGGSSAVTANNAGTLNLSGGSFTFNAGGTGITSNTTAANSGVATINLSGTGLLELANQPITINGSTSSVNLTGGTLSNFTTYSVASSTALTDAGGLVQRTIAGTSTIGALNFTGASAALSVTAGTFTTTAINTTNSSATVTLAGGTLNLSNGAIGSAGSPINNLLFQSGTLQAVGQVNGGSAAGATVTKTTPGTLFYAGTNAYTAATNVSAGILNITTGSTLPSSNVTVQANATLGGSGTIGALGGTVGVNSGGTLWPAAGNTTTPATGPLTIVKSADLAGSSSAPSGVQGLVVTLASPSVYDQIVLGNTTTAGTLELHGTTAALVANQTPFGANLFINDLTYANGFPGPIAGDKFWLVDGKANSIVDGNFSNFPSGSIINGASGTAYTLTYNVAGDPLGTHVDVLLTTVPEPSSIALLGLGAAGLLARRRRINKRIG